MVGVQAVSLVIAPLEVKIQIGPADRQHVGRFRRETGMPVITRGSDERDSLMSAGSNEIRIAQALIVGGIADVVVAPPAHRNGRNSGLLPSIVDGREQIRIRGAIRLDEQDIRTGCDGMRPFDIQGRLSFPALARIGARQIRAAVLVDDLETRRGCDPEFSIEGGQIGGDIRVVVGVDDRDRLAAAVGCRRAERRIVKSIRRANLRRRITADR